MKFLCMVIVLFSFLGTVHCGEYQRALDRVSNEYALDLSRKHGLCLIGSGGGTTGGSKSFIYHFEGQGCFTISQTRVLVVDCIDNLLSKLNANAVLPRYVPGSPYTSQNLEFMVNLVDSTGRLQSNGFIAYASCLGGVVRYVIRDRLTKELKTVHQESLDEARKLTAEVKGITLK